MLPPPSDGASLKKPPRIYLVTLLLPLTRCHLGREPLITGMAKPINPHWKRIRDFSDRNARRIVIGMVGGSILLIGVVLIIVPGPPATLTMALGLTVLGTEFLWAKRLLKRSKAYLKHKLPDAQEGRINWLFAKAARIGKYIHKWLHEHIIKFLIKRIPIRRKR